MPKIRDTAAMQAMAARLSERGGYMRSEYEWLKDWVPKNLMGDGSLASCVETDYAWMFWVMTKDGFASLCGVTDKDNRYEWVDGEAYPTGDIMADETMITRKQALADRATARPVPNMRGMPVWGHGKGWSALGRVVSSPGEALVVRKPSGELYGSMEAVRVGKRQIWTEVPESRMQGFAALWIEGSGACEWRNFYGAAHFTNFAERKKRGYHVNKKGLLQIPGVGHVMGGVDRSSEDGLAAIKLGFRDCGPPLTDEIACALAGELFDIGLDIAEPFIYWFKREWAQRRCARWQDATLFEKYCLTDNAD